jgi:hypothetical protein
MCSNAAEFGDVIEASIADAVGARARRPGGRCRGRATVRQFGGRRLRGAGRGCRIDTDALTSRRRGGCRLSTDRVVGQGEAIRIMTGAPLPAGADASVMVEETERGRRSRHRQQVVRVHDTIRDVGEDVRVRYGALYGGHHRASGGRGLCLPVSTLAGSRLPDAARGGHLDRRRVGQRRIRAPTGADSREQQDHVVATGRRSRMRGDRPRRCPRRRGPRWNRRCATPRQPTTRSSPAVGVSMGEYDVGEGRCCRASPSMRWMQIAIKPGEAVRIRTARHGGSPHAHLRSPRANPGQFDGQLRAVRTAGASQDALVYTLVRSAPRSRRWPDRPPAAAPTERPTTCGFSESSATMAATTSLRRWPRAAHQLAATTLGRRDRHRARRE